MSNRLTFSLASLIFLIALGLVFAPVSVMAHPDVAGKDTHAKPGHEHPVVTIVDPMDVDPTTPGVQVLDTDNDTETGRTGTIQFDVQVKLPSPGLDTSMDSGTLKAAEVTAYARTAEYAAVGTGTDGAVVVTATPDADDATMVTLALTITETFDDKNADTNADEDRVAGKSALIADGLYVDLYVNDGAITITEKTPTAVDADQMNLQSRTLTVQVVAMANTDPTATVTEMTSTGDDDLTTPITFTVTFSEAVDLTMADVEVTGGSASSVDKVGTDGMTWTVEVRAFSGEDHVVLTIKNTVVVSASSKRAPPTGSTDPQKILNAKSYLIIVRDKSMVPSGYFGANGPSAVQLYEWANMPDLEELFSIGGKLELTVPGATTRQVVISEVMWAIDNQLIGQAAYDDDQWIEIYNKTDNNFDISNMMLSASTGRFGTPTTTDWVLNTHGGDRWNVPGQSGNSGDAEGAGKMEFVSMYRNNYNEPGHQSNRWAVSSELYKPNHRGTPGMKERPNFGGIATTTVHLSPFIFNEISNHDNPAYEWIELRNVTNGEQNLKNWEITIVTSKGANQGNHNAVEFIQFPNADRKVPANDVLLIVATDPEDDPNHPLQTGWDITEGAGAQINGVGDHSPRYIVLPFKTAKAKGTTNNHNESGMPDDGEFVLILRNRGDRTTSNADNNVRDVAGYVPGRALATANDTTGLWPLDNFAQPNRANNKLAAGTVQKRAHAGIDGTKSTADNNNNDKVAFRDDNNGWTGIGYRRNTNPTAQNGGTPGFPNNALQSNETQAGADPVIISEVMYASGSRANIPQWIELYNTSKTVGVNLDGWRVTIVNHDQDVGGETFAGDLSKDYAINGKIPPGQTFLLVAYQGRNDTNLPDERIVSLRSNRGELILSEYGFEITLLTKGKDNNDANRKVADKVGNLVDATDGRVRNNPQSYEEPIWMLPVSTNDEGDRISIVRAAIDGDPINGQVAGAWTRFDMSQQFIATLDTTSYGHTTDISSPGHTVGAPLPVSLSKFRPERLDDGTIAVRWITESELDNAGFNILRSEDRYGEFTKLNTQLIAGQGTTSERTAYEFVDKTAKPNVVYYYQIQDVSIDGDVTTLQTTHLRGNVSAAGKLTTIWGELKALQ